MLFHHLVIIDTTLTGATTRPQSMPDKRILELVIDALQRRDTNELFAEPVDPQEVEDYYEIIEEPMDFGTMRAKLHEGLYKSLEQFERDALLIPRNAMHFNSSTTVYFRQARAIHELAKRVFHILKTDPEKFEMEFSGTRRRTRRPTNEGRVPLRSSSSKLATDFRTRRMNHASSKKALHERDGLSNYRKSSGGSPGFHDKTNINAKDNTFPSGPENDGRVPSEADRRSTYWTSFLTENDSIVSMVYNNSKQLPLVEQQDFGYRDSLMMFVKDLGPTAQMVARRKLASCSAGASNHRTPVSKCLFPEPKSHGPGPSIQRQLSFPDKDITTSSHSSPNRLQKGASSAAFGVSSSISEKKTSSALRGDISSNDANAPSTRTQLGSLFSNDDANRARELLDFRLRSDYKSLCSWPPKPVTTQNQSLPSPTNNGSAEAGRVSKPSQSLQQQGSSSYVFDIPFLKTKLHQLNSTSGKESLLLQQGSIAGICNDIHHQQQFALDPRRRDLVLQL